MSRESHGASLLEDSPSASAAHNPHGSGDLACFIVGEDRFTTLAADWTALAHEAPACSAAHTFGYAWDAWRFIAKARGGELRCVTLWRGRRLVCVWPFHVLRKRGIRVAYPLGVGAHEEQGEPLLIEDEGSDAVAKESFAAARRLADALRVYRLPARGRMATIVESDRAPKHRAPVVCPLVRLSAFPDWEAWLKTRSKSFRSGLRYDRRRLASIGELCLKRIEDPSDARRFVGWLLDRKGELVERRGVAGSWVERPETREFFVSQITSPGKGGSVVALALQLDGTLVAGCVCLVSPQRMEYLVTGYDEQYAAFSPGNLLLEECARWAMHKRLDLDLGIGEAAYKLRWAGRLEEYVTYIVACSWAGCTEVLAANLRGVGARLRARASGRARTVAL